MMRMSLVVSRLLLACLAVGLLMAGSTVVWAVSSDSASVSVNVAGATPTETGTPVGSPVVSPTVTVEPTATTPAVNKLPDTGSQAHRGSATAILIAAGALMSAVVAYGIRRGPQSS